MSYGACVFASRDVDYEPKQRRPLMSRWQKASDITDMGLLTFLGLLSRSCGGCWPLSLFCHCQSWPAEAWSRASLQGQTRAEDTGGKRAGMGKCSGLEHSEYTGCDSLAALSISLHIWVAWMFVGCFQPQWQVVSLCSLHSHVGTIPCRTKKKKKAQAVSDACRQEEDER